MDAASILFREPVVPDSSGEFITVREAYNTFVTKSDMVTFGKSFDEHREDDRAAFSSVATKLDNTNTKLDTLRDETRANNFPKWFLPALIGAATFLSPVIFKAIESWWK